MVPQRKKVEKTRPKVTVRIVKGEQVHEEVVKKGRKYCQVRTTEIVKEEVAEPDFKEVNLYDENGAEVIGRHRVPVMETYTEEIAVVGEDGEPLLVGSGEFVTRERPTLNPDYDDSVEYVAREDRPEWNCVGLLGQLSLRKGQPVAPSWVKIKDISDEVELWLVK